MREKLGHFENTCQKFTATFGGWGTRRKYRDEKTVLLKNLKVNEELVADHVWLAAPVDFELLKLNKGSLLEFNAVVKPYLKDTLFNQTGLVHKQELDYTLTEIRDVRLLSESL